MKVKIDVPASVPVLLEHSDNSFTAASWAHKRLSPTNTKSHILLVEAEIKTPHSNDEVKNC